MARPTIPAPSTKYELKQKQVSEYCIKKALKQIDEEDYMKVLGKPCSRRYMKN